MDPSLQNEALRVISSLGALNYHFAGKRILITGAAGFLGSHFVHYFLSLNNSPAFLEKCEVVGFDNFIRGRKTWLDTVHERKDFILIEGDISGNVELDNVDYIIHAASIASPTYYRQYPIETMDTNVNGIRNILDYSRTKNQTKSILYMSSSEIYGNPTPDNIPTTERYEGLVSSIGPRACYDESKRYGETLCVNYHKQYGVPVKIVRPFNVYGVGLNSNDGRVMSDFFRDAITINKICLLSDGKATRTFCYVSDAMDGFIRVLLSDMNGEVYNIGCEKPEISMLELAEKIRYLAGSSCELVFGQSEDKEYCIDNPQRRCPSIDKARKQLGYSPDVSLDDGLSLTYAYYKSIL